MSRTTLKQTHTRPPSALRLRSYAGEADLPGIADVLNAEYAADRVPERTSLAGLAADYSNPNEHFTPSRDVLVAELEGRIMAVAWRKWLERSDGATREYRVNGAVHPDWRRRGVGALLLAENERLARQLAAAYPTERREVFGSWCGEFQPGDIALLERSGYERERWFFEMTRPSLDDVPELPLPQGIHIRPVTPKLARAVWRADAEAFRDHWGGGDESDEALQRVLDDPDNDLDLWLAAFEGDEVVAGVINNVSAEENAALGVRRGWLGSVFTRRPWRRRGLARALISRSLVLLRGRGMTSAVLTVDADNPTGALGLYEDLGFVVTDKAIAWVKPAAADGDVQGPD